MTRGEDLHALAKHRSALMALWDAENVPADGGHHHLREAVLQTSLQFHDLHPEHSVTSIRKALVAWLGPQPEQMADRSGGSEQGSSTTLVKVASADGTFTIYAVSTEHLAHQLGQARVERVIANGRPVAFKAATSAGAWIRRPGGRPITDPLMLRRYDGMPTLTS